MTLNKNTVSHDQSLKIGFLVFPGVHLLDLAGPLEVFTSMPTAKIHLFWKDLAPVISSANVSFTPNDTLTVVEDLDVLCVPGGLGIDALLNDPEVLMFLQCQALKSRYITSVCTGALLLGAAGLLHGRRVTTHWLMLDALLHFGAIPVRKRIVQDGNLITAGGVTAGLDFGLLIVGELLSPADAEAIQLVLEYAPEPPFSSGNEASARPEVIARVRADALSLLQQRMHLIRNLPLNPVPR